MIVICSLLSFGCNSPKPTKKHRPAALKNDSDYDTDTSPEEEEDPLWDDSAAESDDGEKVSTTDRKRKQEVSTTAGTKKKKKKNKRKAGAPAQTIPHQMDDRVREKLDATVKMMDTAQAMSRPAVMQADFDVNAPDTEDSVNERRWPKVIHGLYCLTEQKSNPNGGAKDMGRVVRMKPLMSFYTGSQQMSEAMKDLFDLVKSGNADVQFHATYEVHKTAIFGHETIKQAQVNSAKRRRENGK